MKLSRPLLLSLLLGSLLLGAACKTTPEKDRTETGNLQPKKKADQLRSTARNSDVSFQAFVSRLRQAAKAHDADELASMMTTDFGYHINPDLEGPGVFAYWDENNVWPELDLVLGETFVVNKLPNQKEYMVAPAEFVVDPANYPGYRAGITLINGSWKFAYFVSGKDSDGTAPADPPAEN